MAVRMNNQGEDGMGTHPYAEIDFTHNTEDYVVRITAAPPYRTAVRGELHCHIDWRRNSDGRARRYANVVLPPMDPGDNNQRRHTLLRQFRTLRGSGTSVPSPVRNWP